MWQYGYRHHKTRVLLPHRHGTVDADMSNATVTYNFWQNHRLLVVDSNISRHFRLDEINRE